MPTIGGATRLPTRWLPRAGQAYQAHSGGSDGGGAPAPVQPAAAAGAPRQPGDRPMPAFPPQLVAPRQRAPQTRAGRRTEPAEAAATYDATLIVPPAKGRLLHRSV